MRDITFPIRQLEEARRADRELVTVLRQMSSGTEAITARAVIRQMSTLSQPSSITRDAWRRGCVAEAEMARIRLLTDSPLGDRVGTRVVGERIVPEVRYLLSFVRVAHIGSFGDAARELQVSQPTLSRQIQAVEDAFATKLFIRHGKGVALTRTGSALLHRLEAALPLLTSPLDPHQHTRQDTVAPAATDIQLLSFGMTSNISDTIVPLIVSQLRARWPNLQLRVNDGPSLLLEGRLADHRLDFAILHDKPALETIYHEVILTDRLGLVASPRSSIADARSPVRLHELAGLPLVLPGQQHHVRRLLDKAGFRRGIGLRPIIEIDSVQLALRVVRSSSVFTVLPRLAVQDGVERGSIVFRDIEQPTIGIAYIAAANRTAMSPLVTDAISMVRSAMITLAAAADPLRIGAPRVRNEGL